MVIICLLASISSFLTAKFMNQKEILRVEQELKETHALRDSLSTEIGKRDSTISNLEEQTIKLIGDVSALRIERKALEEERRKAEMNAFKLFQRDDVKNKLEECYPEFAGSNWGFKEFYDEKYMVNIEYFIIPTMFVTAFIQDHIDAVNYRDQKNKLLQVDELMQKVNGYQEEIINMERENKDAYKHGYDDAYAKYEKLNADYINQLKNPQVKLGVPGFTAILGAATLGLLIGTSIQ